MRRAANAVASSAARRAAAGPCVRSRSTSCPRRSGSWSGTRSPRGYGTHTGTRAGSTVLGAVAEQRGRPVEEQPAGVARPADQEGARRGVGHRVVVRDLDRLGHDGPHDQRRAEDHEHVTDRARAGHELLGEHVDRAALEHAVRRVRSPRRAPGRVVRSRASDRRGRRSRRAASRPSPSSRRARRRSRRR